MSQENVDVVRHMLDAFNRGDVPAVLAAFDQNCELDEPPEMPDRRPQGFRGHDGIREWMANLREVAGIEFEPLSFTTSVTSSFPMGRARPRASQRGSH